AGASKGAWPLALLAVAGAALGAPPRAAAFPALLDRLPPSANAFGCATCHVSRGGGEACPTPPCLNPLGIDVATMASVQWAGEVPNKGALFAIDSDGDGYTNGQELLDLDGDGAVDDGLDLALATSPGDPSTNMDECALGYDTCAQHCEELLGPFPSYACTCDPGYRVAGDACLDVDECAMHHGGCAATEVCVNEVGAPNRCDCRPGYTRAADDGPCQVRCGDGVLGPAEGCDDGNTDDGDGCDARCRITPGYACAQPNGDDAPSVCTQTCGDGEVDLFAGERCDDGAANSDTAPGACRTSCAPARCGDGVVDPGESCDDGARNSDTAPGACRTSCMPARCGDGVVDPGERCDDGAGASPDACTAACPDAGMP
ncbi:MAG: DUF4215 domain-containing protein, partial [Myxococcales bacterium]|nr:DUF4215 domain-containing protein [Myxococcales bacterium]